MVIMGNHKTSSSRAALGHLLSHSMLPRFLATQSSVTAIAEFSSMHHPHDALVSLHGKVSWKAAYLLFQLVIDQSVSVEFYIRDSVTIVGAINASVSVEFSPLLLLILVFLCFLQMTFYG
ncbi:hypothetical protein L3X38_027668 [Prunus dulcis]|uniref:Uncharacterized protein n=1 Tax=Prunus dulcis TaxID=3755 RepID=A0AAD4VP84_PRUDU|nr:hypothetical protein L3X38_027668 [Prunus dulcis]